MASSTPAGDAVSSTAATLVGTALRTVAALLTARLLGAAGFGSYTLARILTLLVGVASALGFSPGLLPFMARARRDADAARLAALARSAWLLSGLAAAFGGGLLWLLAPWLGAQVFDDPLLVDLLRPLSGLVVLTALSSVSFTLLQGLQRVRTSVWLEQVLTLAVTSIALVLAWRADLGAAGVIGATLLGPLVALVVGTGLAGRLLPQGAPRVPAPVGELLSSCWPLLGAGLLALAVLWLDVLLLGALSTSREVGIYGACARLTALVVLVNESLGPVFAARLTTLHADDDPAGIGELYRLTARWSLWAALVAGWTLLLWGEEILGCFGAEFAAGASVLALLALGRMLSASAGMSARLLALTGWQRFNFWNAGFILSCNGVLDLAWIPRHGAWGAAAASGLSIALGRLLQLLEVWRRHRLVPWSGRGLLAVPSTAALASLALLPLPWWLLLGLFVLGAALLYVLWGADEIERAAIRRRMGW